MYRILVAAAFASGVILSSAAPGYAAGEILITHAKALAGQVTPGDAPGYPVTLNRPGMYRLAGNLFASANQSGIVVAGPLVTIDFGGFRLVGAGAGEIGVEGAGPHFGATIKNGTIAGFKQAGIRGTASAWMIEEMRVIGNLGNGIECGAACLIEQSVISDNGGNAVNMASGAVIGNTMSGNTGSAIVGTGDGVGFGDNAFILNTGGVFDQIDGNALAMNTNVCREIGEALELC
jgi:hypothetical protein